MIEKMPCPFTGPKMFWAGPNFMCHTKNLFTYCGSHKHSVKLIFCAGTKGFEEALIAVKFLGWLKKFGSAQNILGPVKGQSIKTHHLAKDDKYPHWKQLGDGLLNRRLIRQGQPRKARKSIRRI